MIIKNYNYDEAVIQDLVVDTNSTNHLWVSFGNNLKKVSANKPTQIYYDLDLDVTAITKLCVSGTYVYLAVNDTSLIGRRYSVTNPLTTYVDYSLPAGIIESPIDVLVYGSYVYFLIPGEISGTNAKIIKIGLTGTYHSTIDLTTVSDAVSFVLDSNNEIQVLTNTAPATLVRVYNLSTTPAYSVTSIND
ncbi:MAG: hypothetical protein WC516_05840 [Patescibacteria group bacterium]|jgi:hypothetical protein